MSLISIAFKIAVPIPTVESFDRFLFVGPHPDDMEIDAGTTAAKLAAQGKMFRTVFYLFFETMSLDKRFMHD